MKKIFILAVAAVLGVFIYRMIPRMQAGVAAPRKITLAGPQSQAQTAMAASAGAFYGIAGALIKAFSPSTLPEDSSMMAGPDLNSQPFNPVTLPEDVPSDIYMYA